MKFLFGFALGVVLGMVFAPAPGEQTRARVGNKVRQLANYPERRMQEKAREVAARAKEEAGEIGSRVGKEVAEAAVKAVTSEVLGDKDRQQSA